MTLYLTFGIFLYCIHVENVFSYNIDLTFDLRGLSLIEIEPFSTFLFCASCFADKKEMVRQIIANINAHFYCLFTASFREKTISEILSFYPEMKAKNDSGKDVKEFGNKYWVMVHDADADHLYPGKDTRK